MINDEIRQAEKAFDPVTLQEKLIEPDRGIRRVNRNLQLGNIKQDQLLFMQNRSENAIMLESIPYEYGGYITQHFADKQWEKIDVFIVASNSVGGFGRISQKSIEMKQYVKDESERGFFSRFKK